MEVVKGMTTKQRYCHCQTAVVSPEHHHTHPINEYECCNNTVCVCLYAVDEVAVEVACNVSEDNDVNCYKTSWV